MSISPPKVFVSYSHDSSIHKKWVLEFATILRNRGVDAILDQWELKPGDDLPEFMEQSLANSDYAIMICTKNYVAKANAGEGGVGYEKMIMTSSSLSRISDSKVIPVIREQGTPPTPTFLTTKLYIDFSRDSEVEYAFDELLRFILDAPLYEKPEIGKAPFQPMEKARPSPTADGIRSVMAVVAEQYENTHYDQTYLKFVLQSSGMRRLTLDRYLREAEKAGYLRSSGGGSLGRVIKLTDAGLDYLAEQGIVEA